MTNLPRLVVTTDAYSLSALGQATIRSHELINALITAPEETLKNIRDVVPSVEINQISVDEYGTIVIDNEGFKELVKSLILNPGPSTSSNNTGCLNVSCL